MSDMLIKDNGYEVVFSHQEDNKKHRTNSICYALASDAARAAVLVQESFKEVRITNLAHTGTRFLLAWGKSDG